MAPSSSDPSLPGPGPVARRARRRRSRMIGAGVLLALAGIVVGVLGMAPMVFDTIGLGTTVALCGGVIAVQGIYGLARRSG